MTPENSALEKALQENLIHARHQESQRERYMSLYWVIWAAVLAYVGRQGEFLRDTRNNVLFFVFLGVMSVAILITNLKWNAEFANHMAAAAMIANRLGLNSSTPEQQSKSNTPLPYPEFRGYMALPLKFNLLLSAAPWLTGVQWCGIVASAYLTTYGVTADHGWSVVAAVIAGVIGVLFCWGIFTSMNKGIVARTPAFDEVPKNVLEHSPLDEVHDSRNA